MNSFSVIVKDLVKQYKGSKQRAVDNVNLEVGTGEIYGFLGPNGAGKSTTIKILVTTLFPTSGEATVMGFNSFTQSDEVRKRIGVVYQNVSLDKHLTAEENLRSHAVLYNVTPFAPTFKTTSQTYKKRVLNLLELVGLKDKMFDIVKTYSGGMMRRLDIAKALLHRPNVLFLDEPTTGLDPQSRRDIWKYLTKHQKKEGFSIFLTTQYLEEAEICQRISIIDQGKILITDTPKNLKKKVGDEVLVVRPSSHVQLEKELTIKKIEYQLDENKSFIIDIQKQKAQAVLAQITSDLLEINIKKPSLDDVFIQFTGREIR